ncbi:hypothetical protein SLEP1_g53802 [Rubroshorea leprosula]|uniref:Uncharacterized protein n=1 Tax=Rubroshorea leprosula TaxID=152421 RepID=A0AAV5MD98_9ROSI|nr:hypothetical protein SLEP1_g53802 [Rubroshorea leprosula]
MLLVTEVKNPNRAISRDRGEDAHTTPGNIVILFVMGNELGVDSLTFNVPDGAGGVNGGGADPLGLSFIPVEGGKRTAKLTVFVTIEGGLEFATGVVIRNAPNPEEVGGGGEEVWLLAFFVRDEDGFGGRIGVFEGEVRVRADLAVGVVKLDNLDTVRVMLKEAGNRKAVLFVTAYAPVHGVDVPGGFIGVYLGAFLLLVRGLRVGIAAGTHSKFFPIP